VKKEYFLKCWGGPGMFPDERSICFKDKDGNDISGFVWAGAVDEENGLVRVDICNETLDVFLVTNGGWELFMSRRVWVPKDAIVIKNKEK